MRYHVIYLAAGEREATHLEAPDAAAAIAAVAAKRDPQRAFELLAVMPVPPVPPAHEPGPGAARPE